MLTKDKTVDPEVFAGLSPVVARTETLVSARDALETLADGESCSRSLLPSGERSK